MAHQPTVFVRRSKPTQRTYREAVADVIRATKAAHRLSNRDLADRIGCSDETISNAENERTDLKAVILLAIAHEFGPASIQPVMGLVGATAEPLPEHEEGGCPLAPTLTLAARIADAQAPDSDGGSAITDAEYLAMEADAVAASTALNRFVNRIKRIRGFRLRRVS